MSRFRKHLAGLLPLPGLLALASCLPPRPALTGEVDAGGDNNWHRFSDLPIWDDGLSEISYYRATNVIYGKSRAYVRVHMLNREWMDPASGVKASDSNQQGVAVLKLNIAEEIPTENYNYRYLTTVFVRRPGLDPFKLVVSSQEWCGSTYKQIRWWDDHVEVRSFSYFPGEGERTWTIPSAAAPFESVFVLARAVAATGVTRSVEMITSLRSNRQVAPDVQRCSLDPQTVTRRISVPKGRFEVRRVTLEGGDHHDWFDVETAPPWRLVAFSAGGCNAALAECERRAYWDRSTSSRFYRPGKAP